ncbi:VOC family protein [uncultured Microbacterium sp.]|uniref:VOC family protein n=1 Tax=uncultured Microbacterium sp. TaxID=191216 RepID=UPI0028D6BA3F|nr:VOC family protein [uncultured Microbacterium sp.]
MTVQLFAGIPVTDLDAAIDWYRRLLGQDVSFRPEESEAVWQLDDAAFLYVKAGRDVAGGALVAITADDLDTFLEDAAGEGITPADIERYDEGTRKAVFFDPDGNELGVISLPDTATSRGA